MLKKILSYFLGGKEELEEITVKTSEIKNICDNEFEGFLKDTLEPKFKKIRGKIKEQFNAIEEKNSVLEKGELINKNIPVREKQIMEGNRQSYVKHTRLLLQKADVPEDVKDIEKACLRFDDNLENFVKHTMKPQEILKHFFEHEAEAIRKELGKLKKDYIEMGSLVKGKYKSYLELRNNIQKLENAKKGIVSVKEEIKQNKQQINDAEKRLHEHSKELSLKEDSEEYKKANELGQKKKKAEEKLYRLKTDTRTLFSKFDRALKKYERIAFDDTALVNDYLKDAFHAISSDDKYKGNSILQGIKDKIISGSIDLKNRDKIINELDRLFKDDYIRKTHSEIDSLRHDIMEIDERLDQTTIQNEINDLKERIAAGEKSISDHKSRMKELKKKLESHSEERIMQEIKRFMEDVMGKNITFC